MSSTYLSLFQKAKRECGIAGSAPSAVTGQTGNLLKLVDWVADADENIQSKWLDWGYLLTEFEEDTVVGEKDISAPSDHGIWDLDSFFLDPTATTHKKLEELDYFIWRNNQRLGTQTNAKPGLFVVKPDHDIILHNPPDAVYTLTADYYKTPTRMTANGSVSLIPTKFDRLIIAEAKKMWATDEEAWDLYTAAEKESIALMNRLESLYLPGREAYTLGNASGMAVTPE